MATIKKKHENPFTREKFENIDMAARNVLMKSKVQYAPYKSLGITAKQLVFNDKNGLSWDKVHGECFWTHRPTQWMEKPGRYDRMVKDKKIREEWRLSMKDAHFVKHGTFSLLDDPEVQKEMKSHRKMSKLYKCVNSIGEIPYDGTYEEDFLKYIDIHYELSSSQVITGLVIYYQFEGKKHFYLPDFFLPDYNLIIEIKGDTPYRNKPKELAKKKAVLAEGIEYIMILEKDYDIFDKYMKDRI